MPDTGTHDSGRSRSFSSNRRKFIKAAGVGTVVGLAGCTGGGGGGQETTEASGGTAGSSGNGLADKLRVLTWGGSYGKDQKAVFMDAFEEEFGVDIEWGKFGSDWDLLSKQKASGGGKIDVVQPSINGSYVAIKDDLLEPLNLDNLPNWDNIVGDYQNPKWDPGDEAHLAPLVFGGEGIAYNTEKYGEAPGKWDDIFTEETKGKVSLPSDIGSVVTIAASDHEDIDVANFGDDYEANMELVWERVKEHNEYVFQWWDSGSTMQQLLTNESAIVGMLWVGRVFNLRNEEDVPVKYEVPDEGTSFWTDSYAIAKGSERKKTAEKFINYTLRIDKSIEFAKEIPYAPPKKIPEGERPDTLQQNDDLREMDKLEILDPSIVDEHRKEWAKKFQQIVRG